MDAVRLLHPDFKDTPYWWEAAPPTDAGAHAPPAKTDVLIVGGGYAGLNAALEIARAGRGVVVAEAELFGHGASSRNGGGVSAGVNLGKGLSGTPGANQEHDDEAEWFERLMGESLKALELVERRIAEEAIDCHYEANGRLVGAYAPGHFDAFQARCDVLNRMVGAGAEVLPRARIREEMASDFYHGAMTVKRAGKLHPALYLRGLIDGCQAAGAVLCANTKVEKIDGGQGRFQIRTSRGPVAAADVIVATNGYTGPLTPGLQRGLVPVTSHVIATEELPNDLAQSLIPNGRTISETPRVLCYYRMAPGGKRMIFGGRARFTDVDPATRARLLHQMMTRRFPQLAEARVTHSWTGFVAFTTDYLPHAGRINDMLYCAGCNGSGVAIMSYLGSLLGRRVIEGEDLKSAFFERPLPTVPVPFYRGNPWFLPAIGAWYRLLDRIDRRAF